ncbi:MAG: PKD domain-containing protein [Candidatus Bathyarchaeia archaeon]
MRKTIVVLLLFMLIGSTVSFYTPKVMAFSNPYIIDVGISYEEYSVPITPPITQTPGGHMRLWYRLYNPNPTSINVILGASIQIGGSIYSDPSNDRTVSISPGDSWANRYFYVPTGVPTGSYNVIFAIWDTDWNPQYDSETRIGWVNMVSSVFVQLSSYVLNTGASNVGTIVWSGITYSLPATISTTTRIHTISANPPSGYSFHHWESTGAVNPWYEDIQSTVASVDGSGTLKAVFMYHIPPSLTLYDPSISDRTVTFNGVVTPGTPGTTITRINWNWGDGSSGDSWFPASHTYSSYGGYTVTATAYQSDGLTTTQTKYVSLTAPQYTVTVNPNGGRVYVDGSPITSSTSYTWSKDSVHILDPDSGYQPSAGTRLIFNKWSDGSTADPRSITVTGSATYTVEWTTQYQLTIGVSPSGAGTTNPAPGAYWYNKGTSVTVTETPNTGYVFNHWELDSINVGASTSYTVAMNTPHYLVAIFSGAAPDIAITNIEISNSNPIEGQPTTITLKLKNLGSIVSEEGTVFFFQTSSFSNPIAGEYTIKSLQIVPPIAPGAESNVKVTWNASRILNVKGEGLQVVVIIKSDSNTLNNFAYISGVNVLKSYDFETYVDGYSFSNWGLSTSELLDIKRQLKILLDNLVTGPIASALLALSYPLVSSSGHCYGMAATSILYYTGTIDKPVSKLTFDILKDEAAPNIASYQVEQLYFILKFMIQDLRDAIFGFDLKREYDKLVENLGNSKPCMMLLVFKDGGRHAVTVYGAYSVSEDIKNIVVYDNNYPGMSIVYTFDLKNNVIYSPTYNIQKLYIDTPAPYTTDVIAKIVSDLLDSLWISAKRILVFGSPVNVTITDQYGRILSNTVSEIPGASMEYCNVTHTITVYLPADLIYTINVTAYDEGNCTITNITPLSEKALTFSGITFDVILNTLAQFELNPNTAEYILQIDENGDGIKDYELEPETRSYQIAETMIYEILIDGQVFCVTIQSNSSVSDFNFVQTEKEIGFNVTGPDKAIGFCNVTIPKQLLDGPFTLLIDGAPATLTITANETHNFLYFTYTHSTHTIQIIGTYVYGQPQDFTLSPVSTSLTIPQGGSKSLIITITSINGFSQPVQLSLSHIIGPPGTGIGGTLDPEQVTPPPDGSVSSILTFYVGPLMPPGTYEFYVEGKSGSLTHVIHISLEVILAPSQLLVSINPLSALILVDQSVTLTSTVSGGITPYNYQWYLNGSAVSGATSNAWTFAPSTIGTYVVYLRVTDNAGNVATSETATIVVAPQLTASISPTSTSIIVGQSVTFTSTVSGGYPPYSYQWFLNGAPVSGATSASWAFTPTTAGIYYVQLKVTDDKGNTAQSDAARIAVTTVPVGGYSIPIQIPKKTEPIIPYITLATILTIVFTTIKRKTTKKTKKPQ